MLKIHAGGGKREYFRKRLDFFYSYVSRVLAGTACHAISGKKVCKSPPIFLDQNREDLDPTWTLKRALAMAEMRSCFKAEAFTSYLGLDDFSLPMINLIPA